MTHTTEPTIDTPNKLQELFDDYHIVKYDNIDGYTKLSQSESDWHELYTSIQTYVSDQVAKAVEQTFIPLSQLYDQYSDECFRLGINDSPQAFFRSEKVKEYLGTTLNGVKK